MPAPSAIATFSNLVSSLHLARKVSPQTTGPHSLPAEIIQFIFRFLFESSIGLQDDVRCENPTFWLDEDPLSPSLFPYSHACVCLWWFQILTTVPVYWTRQVITVDAIATSLDATRATLKWVGNHPLKVIVTRHQGTSDAESERTRVARAMELLRPHMSHIWSLSFDVEHSASLPALWRENGCARRLRALTLRSRFNTSQIPNWRGSNLEYEGKLDVPLLQQVTFSGHFLRDPLMAHPRLASWFQHMTSLTICGDVASVGNAMSLCKFLLVIDIFPSVRELTVEDVCFDDDTPYPSILGLKPAVLSLRRITGRTILQSILTRAHAGTVPRQGVTIVDCPIHGFDDDNVRFSSTDLTIVSMDRHMPIQDLVSRWNGESLTVNSCSGMSRTFLERLQGETAPMGLSRLRIGDCDNFGAGDVISLVKSRETQAALGSLMGVSDDDVFTALAEVCVEGRGPPISVKRARWLDEHVARFSWDTVARDGLRYVWDGELKVLPANGCV